MDKFRTNFVTKMLLSNDILLYLWYDLISILVNIETTSDSLKQENDEIFCDVCECNFDNSKLLKEHTQNYHRPNSTSGIPNVYMDNERFSDKQLNVACPENETYILKKEVTDFFCDNCECNFETSELLIEHTQNCHEFNSGYSDIDMDNDNKLIGESALETEANPFLQENNSKFISCSNKGCDFYCHSQEQCIEHMKDCLFKVKRERTSISLAIKKQIIGEYQART